MNEFKGIGIDNTRLTCPQDIIVKVYFSHDKNGKDIVQLCYYKDGIRTVKTKTLSSPSTLSDKEKEAKAYELKAGLQQILYNQLFSVKKHGFKDELNIFIEYKKDLLKKSTATDYSNKFKKALEYFKDFYVEDIKSDDVMTFVFKYNKINKPSSVESYFRNLKMFMNFEIENRHNITNNPCNGIKVAKGSGEQIDISEDGDGEGYLSVNELKELLKFTSNHRSWKYPMYYMIKIAAIYGLRRGELLGLRWKQIDFNNRLLHINNTIVNTVEGPLEQNSTKTKAGMRVYPLLDLVIDDLKEIQNQQIEKGIYEKDGLVFISSSKEIFSPNSISTKFKYIIRRADFIKDKNIHLHSLRHTCVNLLYYEFNFTLDQIAKWVGHSSKYISEKYYLHDNMDWKIKQGEFIDKNLEL